MRSFRLIPALLAVGLALAPALADARAGGGFSFGSRGSRSYSSPSTTSTAPMTAAPLPGGGPSYGTSAPRAPMFGGGNSRPFVSGLMGGLIGAGIGGLLFGGGLFSGLDGIGGFLGLLLQLALVFFAVRWLVRRFMQPAMAGAPGFGPRPSPLQRVNFGGGGGTAKLVIAPADYRAFEQVLQGVQSAWSAHDLAGLRRVATPQMAGILADQIAQQAARGVRNTVTDVRLQKGDLAEAWSEQGREYATVAMRFSMIDVTRDATGQVVDGSPTEHATATEIWTFVRPGGGAWTLSAIQQTG